LNDYIETIQYRKIHKSSQNIWSKFSDGFLRITMLFLKFNENHRWIFQ